jgi:hypothetical protein
MTIKTTKLLGLGRPTAAKTFTRNNNPGSQHVTAGKQERDGNHLALLRSLTLTLFLTLAVLVAAIVFVSSASAETTAPQWKLLSVSNPTNFKPGDQSGADAIVVTAVNVGGASSNGSPVTISDALPEGLTAIEAFGLNAYHDPAGNIPNLVGTGEDVIGGLACTFSSRAASCTTSAPIDPGDTLVVTIKVTVESVLPEASCELPPLAVGCLTNHASISGGGAIGASASSSVTVSGTPAEYGIAKGAVVSAVSSTQAGGHPNFTNEFFLNTVSRPVSPLWVETVHYPKDINFDLPRGLLGTTVGVPRCTMAEVLDEANCPRDTMVGTATLIVTTRAHPRFILTVPVYDIAPAPGEPLALAFDAIFFPVRIDASVLSDGEYNARVSTPDITGGGDDYMASVTIWGDPAEHNGPGPDAATKTASGYYYLVTGTPPQISFGGSGTEKVEEGGGEKFETVSEKRVPLLSNPTQCSEPLTSVMETDSWVAPDDFLTEPTSAGIATGCGQLSFQAGVSMLPDTLEAGAPAGYQFDLNVPQNTEPEGLSTPQVKRVSATLPLGTVISPSAADGLGVCSTEQFYGPPRPAGERPQAATPGACPRDSQVGTARVKSPDLEEQLTGDVYLAAPECTGPGGVCTPGDASDGKMIRLFLQFVGEGEDGVVVKQELTGQINQQTGQLTVTDAEVPQLPFSELKLTLQGGERASLSNPRACGAATTSVDLTPWSSPFTPDASPTSAFDVDENCFGAQFNPSFRAGTTSNDAGGYSPFTVSFGRGDADQFLNGVQIQMPPGVSGMLSNVALCQEPQAAQGACGPASLIGETSVETGPGADPFLVTGGKIYITGPYKGAPYGLSIVVPAKAGPYTLSGNTGNGTVVVRAAISVNPETAALTVTVDPLPTELDGIPLQLRLVNATVGTANNFTFNPTSCNKTEVGGALTSTEAAKASRSSSFQVTNCAALKFQPKFSASTSGKTSRAKGASLTLKVTRPSGPGTGQANFRLAKIELPKQLPSRLTTLQKACTAAVFNANPAACPAASDIGFVKVSTPLLPVPLEGPAYFVSHGGEAFPSVIFVLQGYGITIDAVSTTFISKSGITSATLKTIPDAPFTSFQLTFPEGKYSAFAANGNLCKSTLTMPTEFIPQNGGTPIKEKTKIAVTGCPKAKKVKRKAKKAGKGRKSSINRRARS